VAFDGMENATESGKISYQMGGWMMMLTRGLMAYVVSVVTSHCGGTIVPEAWQ